MLSGDSGKMASPGFRHEGGTPVGNPKMKWYTFRLSRVHFLSGYAQVFSKGLSQFFSLAQISIVH